MIHIVCGLLGFVYFIVLERQEESLPKQEIVQPRSPSKGYIGYFVLLKCPQFLRFCKG